ncbi:MAG: hypothetical protein KA408_01360 [Flavobacteriales bacterium]|nr:hypothetical protein [Flavobacteriales bacterium]
MKYRIDEINIGDEVIFESTSIQSNYDLYWKVIGKNKTQLMIELKEMGHDENWTIEIFEVKGVLPTGRSEK